MHDHHFSHAAFCVASSHATFRHAVAQASPFSGPVAAQEPSARKFEFRKQDRVDMANMIVADKMLLSCWKTFSPRLSFNPANKISVRIFVVGITCQINQVIP